MLGGNKCYYSDIFLFVNPFCAEFSEIALLLRSFSLELT